jgi:hypothetical protein
MRLRSALLSLSLVVSGCARVTTPGITDPGVICTMIAVSSLNVVVRDTATGQPVCDATVIALEPVGTSYVLRQTGDCRYAGPEERAGDFDVVVTRPGYEAKRVAGIRVGRDECHVIPVSVTVDLRPGS